ncbi:MAG: T9SS type A sorting domain-containing protein [candidate division Zixibacteria bacterium]|nr:T9SS type A sorting domain-containing protein [candidate division Zixibacteria bacterium]
MRRLTVFVLGLWAVTVKGQTVDTFPKVIFLDPYSAKPSYPYRDEAFAQLESLRITHIVGLGDAVLTNSKFKIFANNGTTNRVLVSSTESPYYFEDFTQQAHWAEMEAENRLLGNGYSFDDPQAIGIFEGTYRRATAGVHQLGYLLKGPIDGSVFHFTTHYLNPVFCQAEYQLQIGDKTGDQEAVVAKLVVFNANGWLRWGAPETPFFHKDTVLCDSIQVDTIIKVNNQVVWESTFAFQRIIKVKDFAVAGQWQTFKICFFQTINNPFRYQLYWTGVKTLFVDKITVSNFEGRKVKEWNDNPSLVQTPIQTYYNTLPKAPARWYLVDEPYGGQFPSLKHADKLVRSFRNTNWSLSDTVKFSTVMTPGWVGAGHAVYLDHIQPPELFTDWYPFGCQVDTISKKINLTPPYDYTNPQFLFRGLGIDLNHAKDTARVRNKPFWNTVQVFAFIDRDTLRARDPRPSEIKVQVNMALCHGAKGIGYWVYTTYGEPIAPEVFRYITEPDPSHLQEPPTYCAPCTCYSPINPAQYRARGLFDWKADSGKFVPNSKWYTVKEINANLDKLAPVLKPLTTISDGAGTADTASIITGSFVQSVTSDKYSGIDTAFIEIGFFTGQGGIRYFMLVNRRLNANESQNVTAWLTQSGHSYVIDVLTNDTVLTGNTGTGAPFTSYLGPGEGKLFKVVPAPQYISNNIAFPLTWQGKITMDGDVTVSSGKTLKILPPKAELSFLANRDTTHSGVAVNKCEFIVPSGGKLIAVGNSSDPLKFLSSSGTPGTEDWRGIVVRPGGYLSMSNAVIRHAYAGIEDSSRYLHSIQNVRIGRCKMFGIYVLNTDSLTIRGCRVDSINAQPGGYGIFIVAGENGGKGAWLVRDTVWASYYGISIWGSATPIDSCLVEASAGWLPSATGIINQYTSGTSADTLRLRYTTIHGFFANQHLENNVNGYVALYACSLFSPYIGDRSPYGIRNTANYAKLYLRRSRVTEWNGTGVLLKHNFGQEADLGRVTGGVTDSGFNWIFTTTTYPNWKYVWDLDCSGCITPTFYAEWNCWGSGAPSASRFTGNIDRTPYDVSCIVAPKLAAGEDEKGREILPKPTALYQNYPNPFNPTTQIQFNLEKVERVNLEIFNILGQRVRTMLSGEQFAAGPYRFIWDGKDDRGSPVSSGIYVYRLLTPTFSQTKKMSLVK